MMPEDRIWKRPDDIFLMGVNFATWPMQSGESLTVSNSRGSLAVRAEDADGNDVSAQIVEGPPSIVADGQRAVFVVKAGDAGATYWIEVDGPTTDGELLTERFPLEIREHYRA